MQDEPEVVNDTIVSFVGDEFDFMGELTRTVRRGAIPNWDFTLHGLENDWPTFAPLPAVQAIVDDYNEQLDEQLNVVIGSRTVVWDMRNATVRTSEEAFANYLTDEMRAFHDADIAVTNSAASAATSCGRTHPRTSRGETSPRSCRSPTTSCSRRSAVRPCSRHSSTR